MIGQMIRAGIYAFLFLTVGLPILIVTGIIVPSQYFLMSRIAGEFDSDKRGVHVANSKGQIASGADKKKLLEQVRHFRATAASPDEAPRNNRILHVAVVEVTGSRDKRVTIDFAKAEKAGVLVIAEDPINWVMRNTVPMQRAKIAFETPTVFGLQNAHPGFVAGIRSGAFGASEITRPRYIAEDATKRFKSISCRTLSIWAQHFGVERHDIGIWHFTDPSTIWVNPTRLTATGGDDFLSKAIDVPCENEWLRVDRSGSTVYIRRGN